MTWIVIHVSHAFSAFQLDTFFQQELMDINDSATRENLFKLVARQLVITSATRNNDCLDVQVIQRVGHAMEKYAIVRDDLVCFIKVTRTSLRVTAAQIAWRQNRLNTGVPQHGLRCQTYLREQSF